MISRDKSSGRGVQVKRLKVEKRVLTVTHDLFVFTFVSIIYCYYSEELIAQRRIAICGFWKVAVSRCLCYDCRDLYNLNST